MAELEYIYRGHRYWIMEPDGGLLIGWNTQFIPFRVTKITAKVIFATDGTIRVQLDRERFERLGKVYHSRFGEYFYKTIPPDDPEKQKHRGKIGPSLQLQAFAALGLKAGCSRAEVKRAYKRLSLKTHPDTPTGSHDAFIKLNKAYERALQIVE